MLIAVTYAVLLIACFTLGGMLAGIGITYAYYGRVAKDARHDLRETRKWYEKELQHNNDYWCEFYSTHIENERKNKK